MELKTMVLDGIEYVLIPKEVFDKSIGIPAEVPPSVPVETNLNDFEAEIKPSVKSASSSPQRDGKESVMVVGVMPDIKKATGSIYGYAQRLKDRKLQPEDVMVLKTNFEEMPEIPEIARNDYKRGYPPGKWGFYGPGAERDLG